MDSKKQVLIIAVYAGEIMLKNGAETYRVEDTITRLCHSRGFSYVETFVIPTGIFVSIDAKNTEDKMASYIKRVHERSINLHKVAMVNEFSRAFVNQEIAIEEAMNQLKKIDHCSSYHIATRSFSGGIIGGFFALLFQATLLEASLAFVTGLIITWFLTNLSSAKMPVFLANILGGFLLATIASFFASFSTLVDIDKIIIGAIMVMVPGVAITNAIRDSILGDLLSGLARAAEAVIIAVSIAFGVGASLQIWRLAERMIL